MLAVTCIQASWMEEEAGACRSYEEEARARLELGRSEARCWEEHAIKMLPGGGA